MIRYRRRLRAWWRSMSPACLFLLSFRQALLSARSISVRRSLKDADQSVPGPMTDVLIPVLDEAEVVEEALRHFRSLGVEPRFVVSAAENPPNTHTRLQELGATFEKVNSADSSKGHLLNCALVGLQAVAIYDVDSRPTAIPRVSGGSVFVQQAALYCPRAQSSFWHGVAANQTRWSLGFEAPKWGSSKVPTYFVGHGLCADSQTFEKYRFRERLPGEDLDLGYRATLAGAPVVLASGFDLSESTTSFTQFFHQNRRWFFGELTALCDVWKAGSAGSRRLVVRRVFGISFWAFGPSIVASALLATKTRPRSRVASAAAALLLLVEVLGPPSASPTECYDCGWVRTVYETPMFLLGHWAKPAMSSVAAISALSTYLPSGYVPELDKAEHSAQDSRR